MKVCFVTHSYPPGETAANVYNKNFVDGLINKGYEVVVVTITGLNDLPLIEKSKNLTVYRFPLRLNYSWHFFEVMTKPLAILRKIYDKEGFDLIHTEHVFPVPYVGVFAEKNKIPHVVTIEGMSRLSPYSKFLFQIHRNVLPYAHYDTLVSWSRMMVDEYFSKWGIEEDKIKVIPGAVDIKSFNPFVNGNGIRPDLSSKDKVIIMAKPMYLTNAIGMAYVIKAMKIVSREYRDCELIVCGDGRMKNNLIGLMNKMNLDNFVRFIGWIPQKTIPIYYNASDVITDSIIYKHAGSITVLESLSCGKPNVLTDIECLPGEHNKPNKNIAMLSKPRSIESMAVNIIKLLNDKTLGKKLSRNAWNLIKRNFTVEKIVKMYNKVYTNLV